LSDGSFVFSLGGVVPVDDLEGDVFFIHFPFTFFSVYR
jgi:hypothetical protein